MINYRREVGWDISLVDLEQNSSTLTTQFTKTTAGIPNATINRFIPAALAQVNDGTLWYNSGTTALPVWTQLTGGGGGGGITSINGDVTAAQIIAAGPGISIATLAGTTTVTNTGVRSLNGLTGVVTISAGANITLTPVGNDIQIAAAGGGGGPAAPLSSLQYNNAGAFGGTNSIYTPGAHPTRDLFAFGAVGDNAVISTFADNLTSLRVRGLDFFGVDVTGYEGIFNNVGFNTLGNLQTRHIVGGNIEMDMEVQSPNALLLTAVDNTIATGKILASSRTGFIFNLRADAETVSPKQLIVDRLDTVTTGVANTSDMVFKTSDGSSIHFDEPVAYSNATGITAFATGGQAAATQLTEEQNNVTVVATNGDSVKLPDAVAGLAIKVMNNGAANLAVFPFLGDLIDGGAVNASVTLTPGEICNFMAISTGAWESDCNTVVTDATLTGNGTTGSPLTVVGGGGGVAYAEYVQHTQGSNVSVAPGTAIEYLTDNPAGVFDTIGITTLTGPGAIGTAFQLPVGVYMVDYENSADAAWSLAIYQGVSNVVLTVDTNTISGASTATTWIHGRAIVQVTGIGVDDWIMISPVTGTQAIPTAGTAAGEFIARLTLLKIA